MGGLPLPAGAGATAGPVGGKGFKDVLINALNDVNDLQFQSDALTERLVTGQVDDVAQVMMAAQKAELSLQMALQVRNKLIESYQEIMRMQV